eukprot:gene1018-1420_t
MPAATSLQLRFGMPRLGSARSRADKRQDGQRSRNTFGDARAARLGLRMGRVPASARRQVVERARRARPPPGPPAIMRAPRNPWASRRTPLPFPTLTFCVSVCKLGDKVNMKLLFEVGGDHCKKVAQRPMYVKRNGARRAGCRRAAPAVSGRRAGGRPRVVWRTALFFYPTRYQALKALPRIRTEMRKYMKKGTGRKYKAELEQR